MDEIILVTFGSDRPQRHKTPSTILDVVLKDGTSFSINANIVPNITGTVHRGPIHIEGLKNWNYMWSGYSLADTLPREKVSLSIQLLIGSDFYLNFILLQPGLYMLATKLGWMLSGRVSGMTRNIQTEEIPEPNMLVMTHGLGIQAEINLFTNIDESIPTKPNIEDFWKLETTGIYDSPLHAHQDNMILKSFHETLRYEGGQYYVDWSWKDENPDLPENRELAFGRLKSLISKMKNNPELVKQYDSIIQGQQKLGIIERIKSERKDAVIHYIPHHTVVICLC